MIDFANKAGVPPVDVTPLSLAADLMVSINGLEMDGPVVLREYVTRAVADGVATTNPSYPAPEFAAMVAAVVKEAGSAFAALADEVVALRERVNALESRNRALANHLDRVEGELTRQAPGMPAREVAA